MGSLAIEEDTVMGAVKGFKVTPALCRRLLDYDPETGVFTWRARTPGMFQDGATGAENQCATWNKLWAGKRAGSLSCWKYYIISIFGKKLRASRVAFAIMTGEFPSEEIDHVNLNTEDDSWENLRHATRSQNAANRRRQSNNVSGFKGVDFHRQRGKWRATLTINRKQKHLGYFGSPEAAAEAYDNASSAHFKGFSRQNKREVR